MRTPLLRKIGGPGPWLIFAAALAYRLAYFLTVRDEPLMTFVDATPDARFYHNWALDILARAPAAGVYVIGPAYAWFLAAVYKICGVHFYAVLLLQLVLGAATAALVYVLARRLYGGAAAAVAGAIWAVYLPAIYAETQILPTAMTLAAATTALVLVTAATAEDRRWPLGFIAGAFFAWAALARPNLLLAAALLGVWGLWRGGGVRRALAAFLVAPVAVCAATAVRNHVVAGDAVVVSAQGGINFYIGNNDRATGWFNPPPGMVGRPEDINELAMHRVAEREVGRPLTAGAASRWWAEQGLSFLLREPGRAAVLYGKKVLFFGNNFEIGLNGNPYTRREFTPFHRVPFPYFAFLLSFGVAGLALGRRANAPARTVLPLYVVGATASVLLFFIADSYRLVVAPGLAVGAAYAITRLVDDARRRVWPAALVLAAVGGLGVWSLWPPAGVDAAATLSRAYVEYGSYYLNAGDAEKATTFYRGALRAKPDNVRALTLLGHAYERLGRLDLARYYYDRALAVDANAAEAYYYRGMLYFRRGVYAGALPDLAAAVRADDGYADAWLVLAECYTRTGDAAAAATAFERLAALRPEDAAVQARAAAAFTAAGRWDEAATLGRRALALQADLTGAHYTLGCCSAQRGDWAGAAREFEAELRVNPTAAPAWEMLAESRRRLTDEAGARDARARWEALVRPGAPPPAP